MTLLCQGAGLNKEFCARAALVTTELAQNLAIHTSGGEILAKILSQGKEPGLELMALDTGPGIRNVAASLRDGHSTAGTAGNGFGAIRRNSQEFEIFSQPEIGTAIWVRLYVGQTPVVEAFVMGGVSVAMDGEEVCGDAWEAIPTATGQRAAVVDGLGHGVFAHQAAMRALEVFRTSVEKPLEEALRLLDEGLKGTRGAAMALVQIDLPTATVRAAGVGNISMRLLHEDGNRSMISENGTLGAGARRLRQYDYAWPRNCLLVMHSDGVSANWDLKRYPGLAQRHPSLIAGIIYRDQHRERDDATIIVVRQVS